MWHVPCIKGSDLKWRQDTLGRGRASDVDHSCEHSVHSVTCCYAGGKHLSQSWTCWVLDTIKSNSIWQHGQDRLSEYTLSQRKFLLGGHSKCHRHRQTCSYVRQEGHWYIGWTMSELGQSPGANHSPAFTRNWHHLQYGHRNFVREPCRCVR